MAGKNVNWIWRRIPSQIWYFGAEHIRMPYRKSQYWFSMAYYMKMRSVSCRLSQNILFSLFRFSLHKCVQKAVPVSLIDSPRKCVSSRAPCVQFHFNFMQIYFNVQTRAQWNCLPNKWPVMKIFLLFIWRIGLIINNGLKQRPRRRNKKYDLEGKQQVQTISMHTHRSRQQSLTKSKHISWPQNSDRYQCREKENCYWSDWTLCWLLHAWRQPTAKQEEWWRLVHLTLHTAGGR